MGEINLVYPAYFPPTKWKKALWYWIFSTYEVEKRWRIVLAFSKG